MTVAIGILLVIAVIVSIGYPLFKSESRIAPREEQRQKLQLKKEALLAQMEELELDFKRGSVLGEVYRELRSKYGHELDALSKSIQKRW